MAAVLSILGGTAGFLAAIISLAIFGAPLLSALAIWAGTGCAFVIVGLARAIAPQGQPAGQGTRELA